MERQVYLILLIRLPIWALIFLQINQGNLSEEIAKVCTHHADG
ncbi:unnamed protein product [Timema podura]|uniref:Uncharacterized protein n=1 Tax=Timema podura TaxID=61482 RepID=A0ABN7PCH2_TIMPD|nr:unnamed protein product [Timema podura]